ncbi:MAG: nucleotidyltransferase domain-containing protein [Lachnospiraceae bacterium]|nr:nucleotidyltransferase domain-containing protein [Lachnospiraceae bacterium]
MIYTIDDIRNKTTPIAKEFGISRMSLFGSYARGEATDDSDVDLYIDRGKLSNLLQYFAFVDELENALHCHVDVVTTGIEDKQFLSAITQEGVLLYEDG